jgi:hypothetical protein
MASEMAEDAEKEVVADTGRCGSESESTKISKEKKEVLSEVVIKSKHELSAQSP